MSRLEIVQLKADALADYDAMLSLFATAFDDAESYLAQPPDADYRRRLLNNPGFIALVAKLEGQVVGALAAYELVKFEQARSEIYLYDLAVLAAYRRRGIAMALIEQLQKLAAERGAWVIFVQADTEAEDIPAIALYERLGQRESVLHFDIPPRRD